MFTVRATTLFWILVLLLTGDCVANWTAYGFLRGDIVCIVLSLVPAAIFGRWFHQARPDRFLLAAVVVVCLLNMFAACVSWKNLHDNRASLDTSAAWQVWRLAVLRCGFFTFAGVTFFWKKKEAANMFGETDDTGTEAEQLV